MRNLRIALAAILIGVGLLAVPSTASAAVNSNLYSFKACAKYDRPLSSRTEYVCVKVYARRQSDGDGWRLNSVHIYAYTAGEQGCGTGFSNPAVAGPSAPSVVNFLDYDIWSRSSPGANLDAGNGCDILWGAADGPMISPTGDYFIVRYAEKAHLAQQTDPDAETPRMRFDYNGSGGIDWTCTANICDIDGPF